MRGAVLFVVAAVSACYSPHYGDCQISCATPDHSCPSGLDCIGGMCRANGMRDDCAPIDGAVDTSADDAGYATGSWGAPVLVTLSMTAVGDPTLTPDMLELYVVHSNDVYVATRSSVSAGWSTLAIVPVVSGMPGIIEQTPSLTADGLTLTFGTDRVPTNGGTDIWFTARSSRTSPWGTAQSVPQINSSGDESGAFISADQLTLFMGSTRGAGGMLDVFVSTRMTTTGLWSTPVAVTELNIATSGDSHPALSPDLQTIYFQSNRTGTVDLYTAHRANATAMFDPPVPINELNTSSVDGDPWVSPDGHHMFFSHTDAGVSAIYETSR